MSRYVVKTALKGTFDAIVEASSPQEAEKFAAETFVRMAKTVSKQTFPRVLTTTRLDPTAPFSAQASERLTTPKIDWNGVIEMLHIIEGEFARLPEERHVLAVLTACVRSCASYPEDTTFQKHLAKATIEISNRK